MRPSKESQPQEQFAVTTNPPHAKNQYSDQLLNDIYARIKAKTITRQPSTSDSNAVLLSYLSASHTHSTHPQDTTQPSNELPQRRINPKKYSINERVKTDLDDLDSLSQLQALWSENDILRQKLTKCQKRVVALEAFECEAEYMRKLILIQDSEIEKLRRLLKAAKQQQLAQQQENSNLQQQNRHAQCVSLSLKGTREPILISQDPYIDPPKQKKCFHKVRPEGLTAHARTESTMEAGNSRKKSFLGKQEGKKSCYKTKKQKNNYR